MTRAEEYHAVTAVIVTHNSLDVIDECLSHLPAAFPERMLHIVVVDSGSTDGTPEHVRRRYRDVRVVEMGRNRGYAAGVNVGASIASQDDALLVMNPDILLHPEAGVAMLDALAEHDVGVVFPKLVDERGRLLHSIRREPSLGRAIGTAVLGGRIAGRHPALSEIETDRHAYEEQVSVDWATGAAMLVSPTCRTRIGGWDESYFLYSEETDYCLRVRRHGLRLLYLPTAIATHFGGESDTSPLLWSILVRNKVLFYRRTHGALPSAAFWLATTAGEMIRTLAGSAKSRHAARELLSRRPRSLEVRNARAASTPWVCMAAQDWWYHNHGHSDVQLMRRVANDRTVLFVNSIGMRLPTPGVSPGFARRLYRKALSMTKGLRRPLEDRPRFYVFSPLLFPLYGSATGRRVNSRLVRAQLKIVCRLIGIDTPVIMVTIPTAWDVVAPLPRSALIFNRSDKHSAFGEVDSDVIGALETRLLQQSDSVLYVSHALMDEDHPLVGPRAHFLDHGVDLEHFTHRQDLPHDLDGVSRPIIGFFGGIDDYVVDLDLLEKTAKGFPDASVVLIGDATCPVDRLAALPNVHLLGSRPYAQIPAYGSSFDVALMPWLDNEWIEACNPIKVKEYLALGLPVVSMWYAEAERYRNVMYTCRSHEEFLEAIARVLAGHPQATPDECRTAVLDASWDSRARRLLEISEGVRG